MLPYLLPLVSLYLLNKNLTRYRVKECLNEEYILKHKTLSQNLGLTTGWPGMMMTMIVNQRFSVAGRSSHWQQCQQLLSIKYYCKQTQINNYNMELYHKVSSYYNFHCCNFKHYFNFNVHKHFISISKNFTNLRPPDMWKDKRKEAWCMKIWKVFPGSPHISWA